MKQDIIDVIENNWGKISNFFTSPRNKPEYLKKVELMESLLERDYPDEHPVFMLINLLGEIVDHYELEHFSELQKLEKLSAQLPPIELLKHLMNEYDLKQSDLVDIFGSQGYVSEILNGKRELNLRHIKALSRKFNISPQCFLN